MRNELIDDVILSSRVRLARNFEDIPFPTMMNEIWAQESVRRTIDAVSQLPDARGYTLLRLNEMEKPAMQSLVEYHLISRDLLAHADVAAVLLSREKTVSIMVNEEDHLRIQAIMPGAQVQKAAVLARSVDDAMESRVRFAFDEQLGYLTACPTNTGSGLRASQMLHLPALSALRKMGAVSQAVDKLGLTIRGLYGEGSEAFGNLYQVSNQVTLGRTEEELVATIRSVGRQLADMEREARDKLRETERSALEDRLLRSYGTLLYARRLSGKEFMQRWSDVRLASSLDMISVPAGVIDQLLYSAQDGGILTQAGKTLEQEEIDERRAQMVRTALGAQA